MTAFLRIPLFPQTEIAVRHSAQLLERNPTARIVFLAPTVNLADQQAGGVSRGNRTVAVG